MSQTGNYTKKLTPIHRRLPRKLKKQIIKHWWPKIPYSKAELIEMWYSSNKRLNRNVGEYAKISSKERDAWMSAKPKWGFFY